MQKRPNQPRVEDDYKRELTEHAGGVFQWVWRYSSKVVGLVIFIPEEHGVWERLNTD